MPKVVRSYRHGTLVLKDGTGTPKTKTVRLLDGGLKATIFDRPMMPIVERGLPVQWIYGDAVPLPFSMSLNFSELVGESSSSTADDLREYEFMTMVDNNAGVTLVSTDAANSEPPTFTMELTITNPVGTGTEVATWTKCVTPKFDLEEGMPNKLNIEGMCLNYQNFAVTSTVTTT